MQASRKPGGFLNEAHQKSPCKNEERGSLLPQSKTIGDAFMDQPVQCSRCGGGHDLYVVICGEPGSQSPGRALVYCAPCRKEMSSYIDVSMPVSLMTPALLIALYEMGKTTSDPQTAVEIVFGQNHPSLVGELNAIIARYRK